MFMSYHTGAYMSPIAYTLPNGLQSVKGSSSTGGCEEHCVMMPISGTTINGCDCPGTNPASGVLIDGDIPSIDTTQRGTWASELFVVNRTGQNFIMIGFQFQVLSDFILRRIEIAIFHCPVQGIGITGVSIYSSSVFPNFNSAASTLLVTHSSPPSDNCQSLSTISIPVQSMDSSDIYFVEFLLTGGSSVYQLSWLYLGEIRFSDVEIPSFTTTTTTEYVSSVILNERQTTTNDGGILTTHVMDESMSGLGPLQPDDEYTVTDITPPNSTADGTSFTNNTVSSKLSTTLGSTDVSPIPIISVVGGLVGTIVILLLLLIIGGSFMAYLVILHRHNLNRLKSDSSLEHHYAIIENPNNDNAPSLELQNLSNPGGEERRPSTAINSLYEPTTETNDHASSNTLSASVPGGDVIYSEIRDMPGVHNSGSVAEEQAQDTNSIDLYDDDDDIIHENHYTIIPEMYILATPVKLNVRPKSVEVSQTAASQGCISEAQDQETKESYSLVHKQSECPPPVPEKSIELQQYLTVKVTTSAEEKDQQQECRGQTDDSESGTQTECTQ